MKTLKLKLFDVLTETISVKEFEQWLYSNNDILNTLDSNDLFFNIVTINYREKNSLDKLLKLNFEKFTYEENLLIMIISNCKKIIKITDRKLLFKQVSVIMRYFDFDEKYDLLWAFYRLKEQIGLIEEGLIKDDNIVQKLKKIAKNVISEFENYSSYKDKLKVLEFTDDIDIRIW